MSILDYYKYALLATASYVRAGALVPGSATYYKDFAQLANTQSDGRLPLSIGTDLFNPANPDAQRWIITHYYGPDNTNDPIASADQTGFGATLFEQDGEKVLAIRGTEPNEDGGVDLREKGDRFIFPMMRRRGLIWHLFAGHRRQECGIREARNKAWPRFRVSV